jgi:hypothetical protein
MAKRLTAIGQTRPRLVSQGVADLERLARQISKNTTYNAEEVYSILRLFTREVNLALQAGLTVKIDGLARLSANLKVGGEVDLALRGDRAAVAALNDPALWTAAKVHNHANLTSSGDELVAQWNRAHPEDPVDG